MTIRQILSECINKPLHSVNPKAKDVIRQHPRPIAETSLFCCSPPTARSCWRFLDSLFPSEECYWEDHGFVAIASHDVALILERLL